MQVKRIAECSKGSILQYFRPSLSYHLSLIFVLSIFKWPLKTGFTVGFYQLKLKISRVLNISALRTTDSILNFSFSENKSIVCWMNEPFLHVLLRF